MKKNSDKDESLSKLLSDIVRLYEVSPKSTKGKINALNSIMSILEAIREQKDLDTVSKNMKITAMTTCKGHVRLQTGFLRASASIVQFKKNYPSFSSEQQQFLFAQIEKLLTDLKKEKESLLDSNESMVTKVGFFAESRATSNSFTKTRTESDLHSFNCTND